MVINIGVVSAITGVVIAISIDGTKRVLRQGDPVFASDTISTADLSTIIISFDNGFKLDLGRNSDIVLEEQYYQDKPYLEQAEALPISASGDNGHTSYSANKLVYLERTAKQITPENDFGTQIEKSFQTNNIASIEQTVDLISAIEVSNSQQVTNNAPSTVNNQPTATLTAQSANFTGATSLARLELDGNVDHTKSDIQADIAAIGSDGAYVLAWSAVESGNIFTGFVSSIYTQRVNADGSLGVKLKLDGETDPTKPDNIPYVIPIKEDGSYIVVWAGAGLFSTDKSVIYSQVVNADNTLGAKIELNANVDVSRYDNLPTATAVGTQGDYIVTWTGNSPSSIYAQKIDINGNYDIGQRIKLDSSVSNPIDASSVITTVGTDGSYVIAWHGTGTSGDYAIYSQKINADGSFDIAQQIRLVANESVTDGPPSISAVGSDGAYLIAWSGHDSNVKESVYIQKINADGSFDVSDRIELDGDVNPDFSDYNVSVSSIGNDGSYVVVWMGRDVSFNFAIFVQRINADGSLGSKTKLDAAMDVSKYDYAPVLTEIGSSGEYIVAWYGLDDNDFESVYSQKFNADDTLAESWTGNGDLDVSTNLAGGAALSYLVSFTEGSLVANSISYNSGDTIAAGDWTGVKLQGVNGLSYDLTITANLVDGSKISTILAGANDNTITGSISSLTTTQAYGSANNNVLVELVNQNGLVVGSSYADDSGSWAINDMNLAATDLIDLRVSGKKVVIDMATPLILDLDGDGIETIALAQGISFDINADGKQDKTGWVAADDGLLVRDINNDGLINDASELFGQETIKADGTKAQDGFEALAELDSNHDGVIDQSDAQFNELKIWQDLNSDGISQENELLSLQQWGIQSISLSTQAVSIQNNGNTLEITASYSNNDGQQQEIADVWFAYQSDVIDESSITETVRSADDLTSFLYALDDEEQLFVNDSFSASLADEVFIGGDGADEFSWQKADLAGKKLI